eukprot:gene22830-biopygen7233
MGGAPVCYPVAHGRNFCLLRSGSWAELLSASRWLNRMIDRSSVHESQGNRQEPLGSRQEFRPWATE